MTVWDWAIGALLTWAAICGTLGCLCGRAARRGDDMMAIADATRETPAPPASPPQVPAKAPPRETPRAPAPGQRLTSVTKKWDCGCVQVWTGPGKLTDFPCPRHALDLDLDGELRKILDDQH